MNYRKFNLAKPREEQTQQGPKTFWDNVGTLTIFVKEDGSESGIVELHSFDKNIKLNAFPMKPRETTAGYAQPAPANDFSQPSPAQEEIRVENIPF